VLLPTWRNKTWWWWWWWWWLVIINYNAEGI